MTAAVAMLFTGGALAFGSALVLVRERVDLPIDVAFTDDFDRDAIGLSTIHATTLENTNALTPSSEIVQQSAALESATIAAMTDDPIPDLTVPHLTDFPVIAGEHDVEQSAAEQPPLVLSASATRAVNNRKAPMSPWQIVRAFFSKKPAATTADTFAIKPGTVQRPYVETAGLDADHPRAIIDAPGSAPAPPATSPRPDFTSLAMPRATPLAEHLAEHPEEADEDDDVPVDEISPERRAELDRAAAAALQATLAATQLPAEPPVAIAQRAAETVHAIAREAERDQQAQDEEASRWAIEITGAKGPIPVDKRRKLLRFYILSCDQPQSRMLLERVSREDPQLADEAGAALEAA
jgi:hypothetical protein